VKRMLVFATTSGDAVENMALDRWLLALIERKEAALCFRSYGWTQAAFTFGYTQHLEEVRRRAGDETIALCRRPSGGGIVDHRNDWTYSIAVSSGTDFGRSAPAALYETLHRMLAASLETMGVDGVQLYEPAMESYPPMACFDRPVRSDIIDRQDGRKIAGAALKRVREGVLIQGTVSRWGLSRVSWSGLETEFCRRIESDLCLNSERAGAPSLSQVDVWLRQYADPSWNGIR
jgi:lipoyl(octanoyl) transferase